jgi:hypothetical protein
MKLVILSTIAFAISVTAHATTPVCQTIQAQIGNITNGVSNPADQSLRNALASGAGLALAPSPQFQQLARAYSIAYVNLQPLYNAFAQQQCTPPVISTAACSAALVGAQQVGQFYTGIHSAFAQAVLEYGNFVLAVQLLQPLFMSENEMAQVNAEIGKVCY